MREGMRCNPTIWLKAIFSLPAFVAFSWAAAGAGLTLGREGGWLIIRGASIPGDEVRVNYLEAYCRAGSTDADWVKHTVIPHTNELISLSADKKVLRLRDTLADGLIVEHVITAGGGEGDLRLLAKNPTAHRSEAHWAQPCVDWAKDVFPVLLENDVPFHIHEVDEYWNDVGSLGELRQGAFDALQGRLRLDVEGEEVSPGVVVAGPSPLREDTEIEGPAWIGRGVRIGARVRLMGPLVLGDGALVGDRAQLRESILFPGTEIAAEAILIGAIAGHRGILQSLRRRA